MRANNADLDREEKKEITTDRGTVNGTRESRDLALAYNNFWWDRGTDVVATRRTSLVVDPPNGRIPALTPEGEARAAERLHVNQRPTEGPEDRPLGERCITGFNSGPPMLPAAYNMNVQIFQTADHVVLFNEMVHNPRIIPLDGRATTETIRQWTGVSRGRWEGDTLVVETKNFLRETSFRNSTRNLHLEERIQRVDEGTLLYSFTVTDPTTWTAPWSVELPMRLSDLPDLRVRLPRGQLRDGRDAERGARGRAAGGGPVVWTAARRSGSCGGRPPGHTGAEQHAGRSGSRCAPGRAVHHACRTWLSQTGRKGSPQGS